MECNTIFTIKGLKKRFDDKTKLDIPFLEIERGKIHALVGSNGAGKTTLLKILAFLDTPSEGQIFYDGKEVAKSEFFVELFDHGL